MDYTLIRSDRRTLAVYVDDECAVEVRAPLRMAVRDIEAFLAAKEKQINALVARKRERLESRAAFSVGFGSKARLLGDEYPIVPCEGAECGFDGRCFYFPEGTTRADIKANLISLYRGIAKKYISDRAAFYGERMGVRPTAVKISSAKTRWGSCSASGSLNFSWRLIMADRETVDYVVVHELAHIKEHNHSDRFWAEVAAVVPDYRVKRARLRELQEPLSLEDWD